MGRAFLNRSLIIFGVFLSYVLLDLMKFLKQKTEIFKNHVKEFIFLITIALIVRFILDFVPLTNVLSKIPSWEKHLFWGMFSGFLAICILLLLKAATLKIYHLAENVFFKSDIKGANINPYEILQKLEYVKNPGLKIEDVNNYLNILLEQFKSSMKPEIKNFINIKEAFIICFLGTFLMVCVLGVMGVLAWISKNISFSAFLLVIAGGSLIIIIIFLFLGFYIGRLTEKGFLKGIIETLKYLRTFKINISSKKSSEDNNKKK